MAHYGGYPLRNLTKECRSHGEEDKYKKTGLGNFHTFAFAFPEDNHHGDEQETDSRKSDPGKDPSQMAGLGSA